MPIQKPKNTTHAQIERVIYNAADEWNKRLKDIIEFRRGTSKNSKIRILFDNKIDKGKFPDRIGECRTFQKPLSWEIAFDINTKWNCGGWRKWLGVGYALESTALHEFGHVIDLPHSEDPSFIMYADYNEGTKLNKKEIIEYRKILLES